MYYSSRSRAELTRELGWKPQKVRADFAKSFDEEVKAVVAAGTGNAVLSH